MRHQLKQIIRLSLIGSFISQSAWSAVPVNLKMQSVSLLQSMMASNGIKSTESFEQTSSHVDFNNTQHVRMQQTYQGYPVWGADSVFHTPNQGKKKLNFSTLDKKKTRMNGLMYRNLGADLSYSESRRFDEAQKEKVIAYAIAFYQERATSSAEITRKKANLMIYVDPKNKAHWAYSVEFLVREDGKIRTKPVYIIDAVTHQVYESWNNLHTSEQSSEKNFVKGGGYGGNRKIGKIIYDGERGDAVSLDILRDETAGICYLQDDVIVIKDLRNDSAPVQYVCSEKSEKRGNTYWHDIDEFNTLGAYSPDHDAFYYAYLVKNMYLNWYKTPVLVNADNSPKQIEINTHLDDANAMWDDDTKEVYFGDGDKDFLPFTSLDIVSHELGHGFTMQNSNLTYKSESGGINEAFSDMAGVAAGYFATGKSNWKIGSDVAMASEALRYMDHPRRDCVGKKVDIELPGYPGKKIRTCSIDHVKDYRDDSIDIGPFRFSLVDVHYSSGIFNKAFYLMSQGFGGDANSGTRKAFDVMVQANMSYWTKNTTFYEAACGVMEATHDYGYDAAVVTKAMAAVGIDTNKC